MSAPQINPATQVLPTVAQVNAAASYADLRDPSTPTALTFAMNDAAPATLVHEATYKVPTTGAASTVTLPAAATVGTRCHFIADGALNGHTVTYRDATGPTSLTTALTASKRHMVTAIKLDATHWVCNAYVSP